MQVRIQYLGNEIALLKKNGMDPGFEKPVEQAESDTDPYKIWGWYQEDRFGGILHCALLIGDRIRNNLFIVR